MRILSEDGLINGMLQGKQPLAATSWAGKTGVIRCRRLAPEGIADWSEWAGKVKVDLAASPPITTRSPPPPMPTSTASLRVRPDRQLETPAELDVSGSPTAGEPAEVEMPAASEPPSAPEPSGESVMAFSVGWGVSESEG